MIELTLTKDGDEVAKLIIGPAFDSGEEHTILLFAGNVRSKRVKGLDKLNTTRELKKTIVEIYDSIED